MQIRDCMKRNVISISTSATIGQAAARLAARRIGMLPVVDQDGRLVGILQMSDLLELVMPDFLKFIQDFDFVHDFGALESQRPSAESMARSIQEVMQEPLSVREDCGLLRAFSLLDQHDLIDIPVVTAGGRLVGIASRVDVGTALLSQWRKGGEESP